MNKPEEYAAPETAAKEVKTDNAGGQPQKTWEKKKPKKKSLFT